MNPILRILPDATPATLHVHRCVHCGGLFEILRPAIADARANACESCKAIWNRPVPVPIKIIPVSPCTLDDDDSNESEVLANIPRPTPTFKTYKQRG